MRKEKLEKWGDKTEISHVYSWDNLSYVIEVGEKGLVMVRDLDGHSIQASHILQLVDASKIVEHHIEMQQVRLDKKLSSTRNELLAEINTQ